ncbi:oligosaccharide flippase family protein [Novipirellula sp. SH528]|uniref:oligosaccharide flippase family protein n=1 Tax=Novipirellula sp. SH528 TaxID=3454466 RepID=UPI003F9F6B8E
MSSFRVISRNVLSNWMAYVIQVLVTFFLTPFVLSEIGDARYGVWAMVISVTGYYGLLDLGLRAGMTQYITRYFSQGDFVRMNMAASSGFALNLICALGVVIATMATAIVSPQLFSMSADLEYEAITCILILGCSTAMQLVLFPFSVALTAKQRFDLVTAVSLFCRLLSAAATVALLVAGYGLIGVCIAGALSNILEYLLRWIVARRILPELRITLQQANWTSCRECMGFGFWSALLAVSHLVINLSDALVIGIFMPVSAIAFFALANNLVRYFANIFVPVSQVFYPAATDLDARDDFSGLQRLYLTGTRVMALIAVSAALIIGWWAKDFYALWVGPKYVETDIYHSVPLLFQVLLVGALFTAVQGIGSKILLGRRKVKGLTWLIATEGAMNLLISIALIRQYGLLGVALGTTLPAIVCRGFVHPIMVCSNLKLRWNDYAREITYPTLMIVLLLPPLIAVVHRFIGIDSWAELFVCGVAASTLALILICSFGLSSSDRRQYLYPTISRLTKDRFVLQAKN